MAGLWYEQFEEGMTFRHEVTRTVTETDNLLFTVLANNDQPLHLDIEFAKNSIHGGYAVNSLWTMSFVLGVTARDTTSGTTMGNLGFEEVRFPRAVKIGDTLRSETSILGKRESRKYPNAGIVTFQHTGYNQRGEVVMTARRHGMMLKRPVPQEADPATGTIPV